MRRRGWILVMLMVGCGGGGGGSGDDAPDASSCDPSVRTYAVPDPTAPFDVLHIEVDPAEVDPVSTIAFPTSQHQLYLPDDPDLELRDELFVMLPGTNGQGQGFQMVTSVAAQAGYPAIALAYESEAHPDGLCQDLVSEQAILECREDVWAEKVYGADVTAEYPGDEPNSITGRLLRLLQYVDAMYPQAGADRYYQGDEIVWENIVLAGFSQGSLLAAYIAKDHAVARLVMFAGGCDAVGDAEPVPWCFEARATPPERSWMVMHVDDEPDEDLQFAEAYGILELGDWANASTESPSYCTNTHAIQSHEPTAQPHLSVAADQALPLDDDGVPTLAEDYYYLLTAP